MLSGEDSQMAFCSNGETSSVLKDWRNMVTMVSDDDLFYSLVFDLFNMVMMTEFEL